MIAEDNKTVVVEVSVNASLDRIWKALTQVEHMRPWYFDNIPDFQARLDFGTRFPVYSGDRCFTHIWEINAVEAMRSIGYSWRFEEYSGLGQVGFEILGEQAPYMVRVTDQVLEDFPDGIPEFERSSCVEGWTYFLCRLKNHLESVPNSD